MVKVHVMVGVAASGKTTQSKIVAKNENATRISSDDIRLGLIYDGTLDVNTAFAPDGFARVAQIMHDRAVELVRDGKNVLLDAQHIKIKNRKAIFDALANFDCYYIAHVMMTDKDECERRHKQRLMGDNNGYPFPVPQRKTFEERFALFVMPTKGEGFDEIRYYGEK